MVESKALTEAPHKRATAKSQREPQSLMQALAATISNPDFDVEKLRQLRAVYVEELTDQRRQEFNTAMAACQAEMPVIKTNKKNPDTNSLYASLDQVDKVIRPIYTHHGFSVTFNMGDGAPEGHYRIVALVAHDGGFERTYQADFPSDRTGKGGTVNKTGIHAMASTMSYAQRYMAKYIFNLSIEGEDKDGNSPNDTVTEEQIADLRKIMADAKIDEAAFLKHGNLEKIEDLPRRKFNGARTFLMQKASQPKTTEEQR